MNQMSGSKRYWPLICGTAVALLCVLFSATLALAQEEEGAAGEGDIMPESECQDCHLDVARHWEGSAHAHAFDDEYFQERWQGMGEPGECLACHTTDYIAATGEYAAEGVQCAACHGAVTSEHPPEPIPIQADAEFCGVCHTTTLGEWHLTGHAAEDIGCMDCHDPHSQDPLFANEDDLCINCHSESMGDYLEDMHVQEGIGCVDCHALVIPPDPIPDDGIVPTGHAFNITPATCVACHTDTLHAGFSLPGYEHGASGEGAEGEDEVESSLLLASTEVAEEQLLTPEQQVQTLEAALANRNVTLLFQGGVLGLVLGGTTAWYVANNVRMRREDEDEEDGQE